MLAAMKNHTIQDRVVRAGVFAALVALAVAVRLLSETPNFSAVTATALFAGFYFRHSAIALCVPLLAMSISDVFLGGYEKGMMLAVYLSLMVPIAWRGVLRHSLSPVTVGAGAICATLSHFVLSNGAVWYAWYERSWEGLVSCYVTALPFLANAMTSDLVFSATFFGLYALATRRHGKEVAAIAAETA
jgi:hypothetical protein